MQETLEERSEPTVDWEQLIRRYDPMVRRAVRRCVQSARRRCEPETVDELVQETYFRLLRSPASQEALSLDAGCRVAYLRRAARNVALDWLRRNLTAKRGRGRDPVHVVPEQRDPAPSPEERLIQRERQSQLEGRLLRLMPGRRPHRSARILELAVVQGMTSREIVRALDEPLSPSSVHTALHRIRKHLVQQGRTALVEPSEGG